MIENKETINTYYHALLDKDISFKNKFYVGVKTTGIFCISTCYARKPKFENVDFYEDLESVKAAGFRACKLCHPTLA